MYIIAHRKFFFWLTGSLLAAAVGSIMYFGLPFGIDFTGGALLKVDYPNGRPAIADIQQQVSTRLGAGSVVRALDTSAVTIRSRAMTPEEQEALLRDLSTVGEVVPISYTSVGPSLGNQFTNKSLWAIFAVALVIVLYIAIAFRKVSRPVPSWGYGLTVVAMLAIDIIVPTGFYAAYAHFTGAEVDALFIVALLALIGYVVNDIIVVFDRVRENLIKNEKTEVTESFEETIGRSIDEIMARSINTSLTTALVLVALIFFGAESIRSFAIVILVGVIVGTFSSICRSAPLLIPLAKWFAKR